MLFSNTYLGIPGRYQFSSSWLLRLDTVSCFLPPAAATRFGSEADFPSGDINKSCWVGTATELDGGGVMARSRLTFGVDDKGRSFSLCTWLLCVNFGGALIFRSVFWGGVAFEFFTSCLPTTAPPSIIESVTTSSERFAVCFTASVLTPFLCGRFDLRTSGGVWTFPNELCLPIGDDWGEDEEVCADDVVGVACCFDAFGVICSFDEVGVACSFDVFGLLFCIFSCSFLSLAITACWEYSCPCWASSLAWNKLLKVTFYGHMGYIVSTALKNQLNGHSKSKNFFQNFRRGLWVDYSGLLSKLYWAFLLF